MAKRNETRDHEGDKLFHLVRKVEAFLVTHVKAIIIFTVIAVVGVGTYFTMDYLLSRKEENANNSFGIVYIKYRSIQKDKDLKSVEKNKKLEEIVADFQKVRTNFPGSRAATRSSFFAGNILYDLKKYDKAAKEYDYGYQNRKKSYLAVLCLLNEATCYEQMDNLNKAENIYKTILSNYKKSYLLPTAKFQLGKLYEIKDNEKMAETEYNDIITNYDWSNWKDFAEKRLLLVKALQ